MSSNLKWGELVSNSRGIEVNNFLSSAFFCCYTEVLQSEALISTAFGDVMIGVDGLGDKNLMK